MADNRIDTQLERLSAAKTSIKEAIIEKLPANETFSAEKLDGYPNEIRKITTTKELTGATATEKRHMVIMEQKLMAQLPYITIHRSVYNQAEILLLNKAIMQMVAQLKFPLLQLVAQPQ